MNGFMCGPRVYEYGGWTFEFGHCGPWPLKKNGDVRKRMGRKFLKDVGPFFELSDTAQKQYRIGGGCIAYFSRLKDAKFVAEKIEELGR